MMRLARQLLESIALGLAATAAVIIFHYFGGFTVDASILLGVCFAIVAVWLYQLFKLAAFKPYCVQIFVNFDALRDDLGLPKPDKPSDPDDDPVYEIFNFTAINAAVFACYKSCTAKTAMEMNITADRLARSDEEYKSAIGFGGEMPNAFKPVPGIGNTRPNFFFRPGRDGYQFGIQVVPEWWKEYGKRLSAQIRELPVCNEWWSEGKVWGNSEYIVLVALPYGYIPDHVRRWDKPVSLFYPFGIRQRQWKAKLGKHGWSMSEHDPGQIVHRYLSISYYGI
jgi:hypothetical protein